MRKKEVTNMAAKTVAELLLLGPEFYFGHEGEEDANDSSNDDADDKSGDQGGDGGDASNDSQDDKSNDDGADNDDDKDPKGLKSALDKERRRAKAAERELNRIKKADEDEKSKKADEVAHAQKKEQEARDKIAKLSAGFLNKEIEGAIRKAATEAGFIDTDDAIAGVDRSSLTYEQDDEDPSDIDLDVKSIEKAVKALATKKPHFIKRGTDDGQRTGGGFGGGGSGNDRKDKNAEIRSHYPALNH